MPEPDAIRATIAEYTKRFSADDREGWLDLWAPDATMEDPVGTPIKRGREEIGAFYDEGRGLSDSIELRPLGIVLVVGNEATFAFEARPTIGADTYAMPVIDHMVFDDDARIVAQRAFVDHALLAPASG